MGVRARSILALLLIIMQADRPGAFATDSGASTGEVPQLPPPNEDESKVIPTLKLGETIRFEEMGPIILNADGTTRRIANWDSLTEQEQKATWRRISKRNEERRKQLLQAQAEAEQLKKDEL